MGTADWANRGDGSADGLRYKHADNTSDTYPAGLSVYLAALLEPIHLPAASTITGTADYVTTPQITNLAARSGGITKIVVGNCALYP